MKQRFYLVLTAVSIFVLTPVVLTLLLSGKDAIVIKRDGNLDDYLPAMLCRQIPWEYEEEMKKVQAVLARSSLYFSLEENKETQQTILKQWKEEIELQKREQEQEGYRQAYDAMEKAVKETQGEMLFFQGKVCEGAFHRVSGGKTRDGLEVMEQIEKGYLIGVDSSWDMYGEGYLTGHYFSKESFKELLKEEYPRIVFNEEPLEEQIVFQKKDSAGYLLEVEVAGQLFTGEKFRQMLQLPSSNLTMQAAEDQIRFLCKGQGHGMGLSQYGGNVLAQQGKTYLEILHYYFPACEIKKE